MIFRGGPETPHPPPPPPTPLRLDSHLWFLIVSASYNIDPPETNMYFISNWSIFRMRLRMVCDVSVIKRTCPKGNQFEFPLPFPKRVKKKRNITFRTLHSEKTLIAQCSFWFSYMIYTHKNLNKCISCQIFSYFTGTQAYLKTWGLW